MLAVKEIVFLKLFHISCVALQIVILQFEMLVFSILGNTNNANSWLGRNMVRWSHSAGCSKCTRYNTTYHRISSKFYREDNN